MSRHPSPSATSAWQVVVPVKAATVGKSRLVGDLEGFDAALDRVALVRAVAEDTLTAVAGTRSVARVVVVTSDPVIGPEWHRNGALVVPDPGRGLNAAVSAGLARCAGATRVAALLGDLPAARPADLDAVLAEAEALPQSYLPDSQGTGTALRAATGATPTTFTPRFGVTSAADHAADGAVVLTGAGTDVSSLRTDVDDLAGLLRAVAIGLGPATSSLLAGVDLLGWAHAGMRP